MRFGKNAAPGMEVKIGMKVQSSNLESIDYDGSTLTVVFKSGHVWKYANVPPEIWEDFQKAESPGGFFHKSIRGIFEGTNVTPPKEPDAAG